MAYSKRLDLLSVLVSAVELLRVEDIRGMAVAGSVHSDRPPRVWRVSDRLSEAEGQPAS
jgi:hypothetical protein